jgi:hypothetical protein
MPKGTTSKETEETRSYGKKLIFMVKFPEFLGSPTYKCGLFYRGCHSQKAYPVLINFIQTG